MPIDAYSVCPGGTGKKIKFCCPDFLPELEKIDRMVEGEQFLACCQHIDHLQQSEKPRACLMAIKAMLLRATNQFDAAQAHVADFTQKYPENCIAWAESAILAAAGESGHAAMPKLQNAILFMGKQMQGRVYDAIDAVAEILVEEGDWLAGRALWRLQTMVAPDDQHPMEKLMLLNRSAEIPLLMKSEPPLVPCPAEAPWKARFEEAMSSLQLARWQQAAQQLAGLAQDVPDAPAVWLNLAVVRGWLADDEGAIEAWRKYAALQIPLEDAVEAEALAMMLSKDPLGDSLNWVRLSWSVRESERLQEILLSDRRIVQVPFDPSSLAEADGPPPRMVCLVLDRPVVETAEGLTLSLMPRVLGQAMLYGKQTDREARFELQGLTAWDVEAAKTMLGELGADTVESGPQEQIMGQTSASHQLLVHRWHPPREASREQLDPLAAEYQRQVLLERWPDLPLGILGGRSPRDAAADPANHIRLLAAIVVLDHWCERIPGSLDLNELRSRLGLPVLGPIDPAPQAVESMSLMRLGRVNVESLSDQDLLVGFRRAILFRAWSAVRKFSQAIVARPSFTDRPERFQAYSMLAQSAENFTEAMAHVDEGRRESQAAGRSCASWDLLELSFRFARGEAHEAMRLVQHVESQHMQEPGVAQTLTRMLVDVGLLNPDGTPARMGPRQEAAGPMAAEAPAEERGRLWTPGGEQPPSGGGGGKLWTPG